MAGNFQQIGLIGKYADPGVGDTLSTLATFLRDQGCEVLLDEATAQVWGEHDLRVADREQLASECDLTVVVGGDGTLLNAARSLAAIAPAPALLGINLGRLGFLTDISPAELELKVGEVLQGKYQEEERFLLHCTIVREGEHINESDALNDVVIHKWDVARMIGLDSYVNGGFVNTTRADGLIVSTPTGSTAYALSGGGPILHPTLNAIVLVPICPHTMSNRPIVVDGDSHIEIVVGDHYGQSHAQVTCDGQINLGLVAGDHIHIRKKDNRIRLIHPVGHDHFHVLRAKLNWG